LDWQSAAVSQGIDGPELLWRAVGGSRTLTTLSLKFNGLDDTAVAGLCADALPGVLMRLDLEGNEIGPAGAQALAASLESNRSLRVLNLGANPIGDVGVCHLAAMVRRNAGLESLNITSVGCTDRGGMVLALALGHNSRLARLFVSGNPLSDETEALIAGPVRRNLDRANRAPSGAEAIPPASGPGAQGAGSPPRELSEPGLRRVLQAALAGKVTLGSRVPGDHRSALFYGRADATEDGVVVKVYLDGGDDSKTEAAVRSFLGDKAVAAVLDSGMAQGLPFIVMERGFEDLSAVTARTNKIPCDLRSVAKRLRTLLVYLAERRLVHARLTPASFMRFGTEWKLVDLDSVVFCGTPVSLARQSLLYCSPEQAQHIIADRAASTTTAFPVDSPSSLFILGIIIAELYTPAMFKGVDPEDVLFHWAEGTFQKNLSQISHQDIVEIAAGCLVFEADARAVV
jgi:hypothetical protein